MPRRERISHVIAGVIRQACVDAGVPLVSVDGSGADADFVRQVCQAALGPEWSGPGGLRVHAASKTVLLLGVVPDADILPLGDLYYSQVVELAGAADLPPLASRLAGLCGGTGRLDAVLRRYFDERAAWDTASAGLPDEASAAVLATLTQGRFRRSRLAAIVPKIGPRTLGADLYA